MDELKLVVISLLDTIADFLEGVAGESDLWESATKTLEALEATTHEPIRKS